MPNLKRETCPARSQKNEPTILYYKLAFCKMKDVLLYNIIIGTWTLRLPVNLAHKSISYILQFVSVVV